MARPQRFREAGVFHVTSRGVRKDELFRDVHDYELFLRLLGHVVREHEWQLLTYCLMPNHFHLLVEPREPNLSDGMHRLKLRFAKAFNQRYGYVGHVFEGRFRSSPVESEEHFFEAARYIVLNPVRARLCAHPARWHWSSYAATLGRERTSLLSLERFRSSFGGDAAAFAAYVAEAIGA